MGYTPGFIQFGKRAAVIGGVANAKYKHNGVRVINSTGSDIAADKLVAIVGYNTTSELPKIVLADANNSTHKDVYVTLSAIGNGDAGFVWKGGLSGTLDTSSVAAAGDPLYLSETAGAFTATPPGGGAVSVRPVGWAITDSATGQVHWHIGEVERADAPVEVLAALDTLTAADNGKTFFLNHATEFAITLPAPFLGANFEFICANAPESADYTIVTEGGCQVLAGHTLSSNMVDSGDDSETAATGTTVTFVQAVAVVGDRARFNSDGTSWFVSCFSAVTGGITITG